MFPMTLKSVFFIAFLTAGGITPPAVAQSSTKPDSVIDSTILNAGFLTGHPDLRFRLQGVEAFKEGKHTQALQAFQRASLYGDKPSQAMVAEMLWNGQGAEADRALAYAWMDLAAERAYLPFLRLRERYWDSLDASEQARALTEGIAVYARYGDSVAQPRLDAVLRRERRKATGSRTGFIGSLKIYTPGADGHEQQIDGSKFYDPKYWDPVQYRAWQDSIWTEPKIGTVNVGSVEAVSDTPSSLLPPPSQTNPSTQEKDKD